MTLLIVYYKLALQCVTLLHITGYCEKYYLSQGLNLDLLTIRGRRRTVVWNARKAGQKSKNENHNYEFSTI